MNTPALVLQRQIERLEEHILTLPQVDFPVSEWFEGSYYYRAIFIPANHTLTGARHRFEHECVCIGDIMVSTDTGVRRLSGYNRFWAEGGKKRVGSTLKDTIWLTVHWTPKLSLDNMEEWLTFPEEHEKLAAVKSRRLQASNVQELFVAD